MAATEPTAADSDFCTEWKLLSSLLFSEDKHTFFKSLI